MTTDHSDLHANLRAAHEAARRRKPSPLALSQVRHIADPDDALDLAHDFDDDVRRGYVTEEDVR